MLIFIRGFGYSLYRKPIYLLYTKKYSLNGESKFFFYLFCEDKKKIG